MKTFHSSYTLRFEMRIKTHYGVSKSRTNFIGVKISAFRAHKNSLFYAHQTINMFIDYKSSLDVIFFY